jgi:hypothetical protein
VLCSAAPTAEADDAAARLSSALGSLLRAAQRSRAVRPDLTLSDLHAVITGALTIEHRLPADRQGLGLQIVLDGLRAPG